jgi:inosine/xanthosine triphosphatase
MIVAIASENVPKVEACKNVFNELKKENLYSDEITYIIKSIHSGVADMPLSIDELMKGAKNRTNNLYKLLKKDNRPADFYIGLEGGFFIKYSSQRTSPVIFLESWVYVYDGLIGYWGSSGAIEVPQKISNDIIQSGKELGIIIDQLVKQKNIRSRQGTVGILTKNIVTRQNFFETALKFALAPFYNSNIYN